MNRLWTWIRPNNLHDITYDTGTYDWVLMRFPTVLFIKRARYIFKLDFTIRINYEHAVNNFQLNENKRFAQMS